MKKYIFLTMISVAFIAACKAKKNASTSTSANAATTNTTSTSASTASSERTTAGTTIGKVSHKYKATGCSTVILVMQDGSELTLIPKDKLANDFDVDGLEIKFNYRTLKMPQPAGCTVGMPAEITDLSKK